MGNHWSLHDEAERRKWQNPEEILTKSGVKPGYTFMDIGCGNGFFTLPAARIVGTNGRVFALDINPEYIDQIKKKAASEHLMNLELKTGAAENTVLCEGCVDIVFLGIVLHDFTDPFKVLLNVKRMLKPGGRLVNLDWKKEPMDIGPSLRKRFSTQKAEAIIKQAGLNIESQSDVGAYYYMITAINGEA